MKKIGETAGCLVFAALFLAVFALNRAILCLIYSDFVAETSGSLYLFLVGLRIDIIVLCWLLTPPILLTLVVGNAANYFNRFYLAFCAVLLVLMEIASVGFLNEYGVRPNYLFTDYADHPVEIFYMLVLGYPLLLILAILFSVFFAVIGYEIGKIRGRKTPLKMRLIALPFVIILLFLGIRSSVGTSAANLGASIFTRSTLINEIASNGTFTLAHTLYAKTREVDLSQYGKMDDEEILKLTRFGEKTFSNSVPETLPNIVIILWEGMGSEFIGALGGLPLTPHFDSLANEGMLLTNLYATGTRTSRGIEAIISGFPPIVTAQVIKLPKANGGNFWTIANHLKPLGYNCDFFYGGDADFDNMSSFMGTNGFYVHSEFAKNSHFAGKWGSDDDAVLSEANRVFAAKTEPFCAAILTLSSHLPFDFPAGKIQPYNEPSATAENAAVYADMALGRFFEQAKNEPYFGNTIFLIAADHTLQVRGTGVFPELSEYQIPALFLGKNVPIERFDAPASQIDLMPTLLHIAGIDLPNPLTGNDLLAGENGSNDTNDTNGSNGSKSTNGEILMQYADRIAYFNGTKMAVFTPNEGVWQFLVEQNGSISESEADPDFAREGLARILLGNLIYQQELFSVKPIK